MSPRKKGDAASGKAAARKADVLDVDKFIQTVNKAGKSAVASSGMERHASDTPGYISTGLWPLDVYLGRGRFRAGYPIGKIHELYGPESTGKTTLGIHAMMAVQNNDFTLTDWREEGGRLVEKVAPASTRQGLVVFLETEKSFDKGRAQEIGLDLKRVVWLKAKSIEKAFEALRRIIEVIRNDKSLKERVSLLVWDTLAASPTTREEEQGKSTPGGQANAISAGLRQLADPLAESWMTLLFVNQTRSKIGVMFGNPETTSGGAAPKFYSTLRLRTSAGKKLEEGGAVVGFQQRLTLVKSKSTAPYAAFTVPFRGKTGLDDDLALAWYLTDPVKFDQSTVPVYNRGGRYVALLGDGKTEISATSAGWGALLREHPEVRARIRQAVIDAWTGAERISAGAPAAHEADADGGDSAVEESA